MELLLKPSNPQDILTLLGRLRLHFNTNTMNQKEFELLLEDYIKDLSPYPIDLIIEACDEYRLNPDHQFFPRVSQLLQQIKNPWHQRKWQLEKMRKLQSASKD